MKPNNPVIIKLKRRSDEISSKLQNGKSMDDMLNCKVVLKRIDSNLEVSQLNEIKSNDNSYAPSNENKFSYVLLEKSIKNSAILKNAEVSKTVGPSLCQFDCLDCHESYSCWKSLVHHIKTEHNKFISQRNYEAYLYRATVHICKICCQKLLCDSSFFNHHFRKRHQMSLSDYKHKYNCESPGMLSFQKRMTKAKISENEIGNLCTYICPGCKNLYCSLSNFKTHQKLGSNRCSLRDETLPLQICAEKVVTHKCKICSKLLLCDITSIMLYSRFHHEITNVEDYLAKTGCTLRQSDDRRRTFKPVQLSPLVHLRPLAARELPTVVQYWLCSNLKNLFLYNKTYFVLKVGL